jgi:hypothetical protein
MLDEPIPLYKRKYVIAMLQQVSLVTIQRHSKTAPLCESGARVDWENHLVSQTEAWTIPPGWNDAGRLLRHRAVQVAVIIKHSIYPLLVAKGFAAPVTFRRSAFESHLASALWLEAQLQALCLV